MRRLFCVAAALAAVLLAAGPAAAQPCRGVTVNAAYTPYAAPTYAAPAYYNTYVGVPVAVYAVPGNPTVALNVYPGQFTVVQAAAPAPVNVTVTVNGQKAEVTAAPPPK